MRNIFSNEALKKEHILITGATGGIGYATVKAAVQAGAHVTITGRREENLNELKNECEDVNESVHVYAHPADLNDDKSRNQLVEQAVKENGPITGLVNSAGVVGGGPLDNLTEQDLRQVMELNYFSTVLFTQLVYERMKPQKAGAIVNLSSLSGLRGTYANTAYSASKFAITGFTQSFAVEAIEHNIRVNAVCPGYVDTDMGRDSIRSKGERNKRSFEEQLKVAEDGIPSSRISTAEEVANTIVFLLSEAAGNIVGESVKISGGSVMR
ncbi:SDR family NAD(P)-dependent oxidoreductase [Halobacillus naozhouensis]|uniref:SDR family NAD(P)-dependent oxidoreductase n=1 Tax=Halobacillus naozhouensis TaxID=554880 RepID=A0ABY8IY13_9BACI|nr:SDR family oxidoreductase [Halobacillus naozhouensis]WFT75105.1 SDR family NAD(P)-dependent oxidoreductase [Halobacillus naozhouensis]